MISITVTGIQSQHLRNIYFLFLYIKKKFQNM
jgi:hypothetical protein